MKKLSPAYPSQLNFAILMFDSCFERFMFQQLKMETEGLSSKWCVLEMLSIKSNNCWCWMMVQSTGMFRMTKFVMLCFPMWLSITSQEHMQSIMILEYWKWVRRKTQWNYFCCSYSFLISEEEFPINPETGFSSIPWEWEIHETFYRWNNVEAKFLGKP